MAKQLLDVYFKLCYYTVEDAMPFLPVVIISLLVKFDDVFSKLY